jgi:Kef-type K+ transport system membrane component KefB
MSLTGIDTQLLHFAGALLATAVVSKVVGSALGAALSGYKAKACLQTGVSLIFRGEVALIAANKAMSLQLLPPKFFSAIVLMVVCVAGHHPASDEAGLLRGKTCRVHPGSVKFLTCALAP